jgi:hypothetical protein
LSLPWRRDAKLVTEGAKQRFTFKQPIPIQSYLIAIAAGALVSKKIGPRQVPELSMPAFPETEFLNDSFSRRFWE